MIILLGGQRSVLGKYQFYVSGDWQSCNKHLFPNGEHM